LEFYITLVKASVNIVKFFFYIRPYNIWTPRLWQSVICVGQTRVRLTSCNWALPTPYSDLTFDLLLLMFSSYTWQHEGHRCIIVSVSMLRQSKLNSLYILLYAFAMVIGIDLSQIPLASHDKMQQDLSCRDVSRSHPNMSYTSSFSCSSVL